MAPWDPPDRVSRVLHRAPAEDRSPPDYLVPLGRTVGFGANGAVSNLGVFPHGINTMRRELHAGGFDVVHVHSPEAPVIGWDACSFRGAPVVGTFHSYSTKPLPNWIANALGARRKFNQLHARIAVSQAASWTGRRWFGGTYRVIPNGVDVDAPPVGPKPESDELRVLFIGRPEERKGLPVLLQAFEGLVEHVPARLTVIGSTEADVKGYLNDPAAEERIDALGTIGGSELWRRLHEADVLCAPSLAGESFGMVLTEAFAAGTPVIASEIAGYADVVTHGVDGILVPPADPQRLAEELQGLYVEPERRLRMGMRRPRERPALRLAERRRGGRGGLRTGAARARARDPHGADRPGPAAWPRSTAAVPPRRSACPPWIRSRLARCSGTASPARWRSAWPPSSASGSPRWRPTRSGFRTSSRASCAPTFRWSSWPSA